MEEVKKTLVGKIVHYFENLRVAVLELEAPLKIGDIVQIKGQHTDFQQKVESMQVEHNPIQKLQAGDSIGMKIVDKVKVGDQVLLWVDSLFWPKTRQRI